MVATRHDLKTWPRHFAAIRAGRLRFTVRKNDRAFTLGDILVLREFDPGPAVYSGQTEERMVEYILAEDEAELGPVHGYVVLGFGATLETAGALAMPIGDALSLSDLQRWHSARGEQASDLAATNRRTAQAWPRFGAVAVAAQNEADFHHSAAALLQRALAGVAAGPDQEQAA